VEHRVWQNLKTFFSVQVTMDLIKWDDKGEHQVLVNMKDSVDLLRFHNGDIFIVSDDIIYRTTLDGHIIQEFQGHTGTIRALHWWRGAFFSSALDKKVIQWNPFQTWTRSTHSEFPRSVRMGIKTVLMIAKTGQFPPHIWTVDVLQLLFQMCASEY